MDGRVQREKTVTCSICLSGTTIRRETTYTYASGDRIIGVRHVPAVVCEQCGEAYFDEATTKLLMKIVNKVLESGAEVVVQDYEAA
jgi:YgiT-type zinc finger domain-containing protein